jgi:hypothetical protein
MACLHPQLQRRLLDLPQLRGRYPQHTRREHVAAHPDASLGGAVVDRGAALRAPYVAQGGGGKAAVAAARAVASVCARAPDAAVRLNVNI